MRKSHIVSGEQKHSPRLVSKPVTNSCMRSRQREGVKPGVMPKGKLSHKVDPG
jgi:hypothetical protein